MNNETLSQQELEDLQVAQDMINLMRDEDDFTGSVEFIIADLGITNKGDVVYCDSLDSGYENALRKQKRKEHRRHLLLVK